jgi:flagellar basal body-associated protein FliL
VSFAGCHAKPSYEFDELDSTPAQDDLIEFSLGKYVIPIPVVRSYAAGAAPKRNRVELSFELHALITGDYKTELASMWDRHEGTIRDRVILVCRNATVDELQEPELATLKSHLTDAVRAELGSKRIRRLLISEVDTRQL